MKEVKKCNTRIGKAEIPCQEHIRANHLVSYILLACISDIWGTDQLSQTIRGLSHRIFPSRDLLSRGNDTFLKMLNIHR